MNCGVLRTHEFCPQQCGKGQSNRTMKYIWSQPLKWMHLFVLSLWSQLSATGLEVRIIQVFRMNTLCRKYYLPEKYEAEFNLRHVEVMISLIIVGTYQVLLYSRHHDLVLRTQWHLCKDAQPRKKPKPRKEHCLPCELRHSTEPHAEQSTEFKWDEIMPPSSKEGR